MSGGVASGAGRGWGLLVGVDGGGSKTDVLVVDDGGRALGRARGGRGNHEGVGFDAAAAVLAATLDEALASAGAGRGDVAASGWGLAGLDWPADEVVYRGVVDRLGLSGPAVLCNDAFVALRAAVPAGAGVVVVAGTGAVAAGRGHGGATFRTFGVDGYGDWGAGPEIVAAAVGAVAQAAVGLGPPTALADRCLERSGAPDVPAYLQAADRTGVTRLLPVDVWEVAAAGDAVASGIADRAADRLAASAAAVARRLGLDAGGPFPVALAGRVLSPGHPVLHDRLVARLGMVLPQAVPRPLRVPPVVGAVLEAAAATGRPLPHTLLEPPDEFSVVPRS